MSDSEMIDPNKAVNFIYENSSVYAKARATRIYLEEFRKSKKAILMKQSLEQTIGAQEREAYAHPEYRKLLEDIRDAVLIEEEYRWQLVAAQARIEVFRTLSANNRLLDKSVT